MDVLVDTSVWVAHFRDGHQDLAQLLALDRVLTHPLVLLELACGTPPQRGRMLADMARLRPAHQASQGEVLGLIQREQLWSLGCGAVDMTLLASALITPATHSCGRSTSGWTPWPGVSGWRGSPSGVKCEADRQKVPAFSPPTAKSHAPHGNKVCNHRNAETRWPSLSGPPSATIVALPNIWFQVVIITALP